jgi:hypothetical protein
MGLMDRMMNRMIGNFVAEINRLKAVDLEDYIEG